MLKQLNFLFALFLLSAGLSQAQVGQSIRRSPYTFIYQISNEEARALYRSGPKAVTASSFHTLIDSFSVNAQLDDPLPQGQYLFVHSGGPELVYSLRTNAPFSVTLLQAKPALSLLVHDSLGRALPGAEVRVNHRKAVYDTATATYRLHRTPMNGLLSVSLNGTTLYKKLEQEESYGYGTQGFKAILYKAPLRYIWHPFYDVYTSFKWHEPKGWVRSLFSLFDTQYQRYRIYRYGGYMVTNKPIYRPVDTLRYKAFVVNRNGKPVNGKAILQLKRYGSALKVLGEVSPYRSGAYEGFVVLHDSLRLELDRSYTLELLHPKKKERVYASQSFRYEDYELKENKYSLSLAHAQHQAGQQNKILLRGTSANGLNLLDARVELTVITKKVTQSQEPEQYIPDTLWVHRQPLDAVGETSVLLPDSVFSRASVDYAVVANFRDASNELKTETKEASYSYTKGRLQLSLLQDSLLVQYLERGADKPAEATLSAYNPEFDEIYFQKLQLPARGAAKRLRRRLRSGGGQLCRSA